MKYLKYILSIMMMVTSSYAVQNDENSSIEQEIRYLNNKIEKTQQKQEQMLKTEKSMDNIILMSYKAKTVMDDAIKMYVDKDRLAVISAIKTIKSNIISLEMKNHPAFNNKIKELKEVLKLEQERLKQWKKE